MAVKPLAEIPTLVSLYRAGTLAAPSPRPSTPPRDSINWRVSLIHADITKLQLDAVVNAANSSLLGGGGVDGAIHAAAGPYLLDECRRLGGCPTGHAVLTGGHRLPSKYIIHAVGPVYDRKGSRESEALLRSCYDDILRIAADNGLHSIGLCSISTGLYRYPPRNAAEVACQAVRRFLLSDRGREMQRVVFVTFTDANETAYREMIS